MSYIYDLEDMTKRVFGFLYGCAMHDALLQKAFAGEKKDWVGKLEPPKVILDEYIRKVLNGEFSSQEDHDAHFLKTANQLCLEINSSRPPQYSRGVFGFGNAQKLINITVKHVYTFCYHDPSLRKVFRFCHCPVDQIMLKKVWDRCGGKGLGKKTWFLEAWGREGTENGEQPELAAFPARYQLFQEKVRELIGSGDLMSVEFDYAEWKQDEK